MSPFTTWLRFLCLFATLLLCHCASHPAQILDTHDLPIITAANPPHRSCVAIDAELLDDPGPLDALRIWGRPSKFWENGTTLRVRFLDGSASQQQKAWTRFQQIDALCGLSFCLVPSGPSDIRVAFVAGSGHWSYLGRDALTIPQNAATMNLGLSRWDGTAEWDRVALHEILHAVGMDHEQQHPSAGIRWNEARVIADYARTQGWSEAQTRRQVLTRYRGTDFSGTTYDADSIMHYPLDPSHTLDGRGVGWNRRMSAKDVEFLQRVYPITP